MGRNLGLELMRRDLGGRTGGGDRVAIGLVVDVAGEAAKLELPELWRMGLARPTDNELLARCSGATLATLGLDVVGQKSLASH